MRRRGFQFIALSFGLLISSEAFQPVCADQPPKSGVAVPPVAVDASGSSFDPTFVNHRGQVLLVLYVGKDTDVPTETVTRVNDWQTRLSPEGFQAVVIAEGDVSGSPFNSDVFVVMDSNGETRRLYQVTEDREYFLVDRYGRLRRQRINESLVRKALAEHFDPSWVGYSGAWNQSYYVFRKEHLLYIGDTLSERVGRGGDLDVRMIALPTFSEPQPGRQIHNPIHIEARGEGVLEEPSYKVELKEDVQVSTEITFPVRLRSDVEPGFHLIWVRAKHSHCGFGDCAVFEKEIPIPIWVE